MDKPLEQVPGVRLVAYCLMPNHWHLVLWPRADGELSDFMHWLTLTHTQRWHAHYGEVGSGHLYQGRFKSFPVQTDEHFLTVCRYVERNALRAGLVQRAEDWRWGSLGQPGAAGGSGEPAAFECGTGGVAGGLAGGGESAADGGGVGGATAERGAGSAVWRRGVDEADGGSAGADEAREKGS